MIMIKNYENVQEAKTDILFLTFQEQNVNEVREG